RPPSHRPPALPPWTEPALPIAWPPGMAPSVRDEGGPYQEDQADSELPPQPDPSWPRLFSPSHEGDATHEAGDGSDAQQATTGPPVEIGREQNSEEMGEDPHPQQEGTGFEPSGEGGLRSSAGERGGEDPGGDQPVGPAEPQDLDATSEAGLASGEPAGKSAAPSVETRHGEPESSDEVPVGSGE